MFPRLLPALALVTALGACETMPPVSRATPSVASVEFQPQLFPRGVRRSNRTLAEDFLELTFALESGQSLNGLLRHEGPVFVVMRSAELKPYARDLSALLRRLQREAGVDIRPSADPARAQIHIEAVPSRQIQRVYPGAACFIVPGETSWRSFRAKPRRDRMRWSDQATLGTTAIFVPSDSTPQDVRDCLHEEIAQALGTANDVYRLPDSIFNDDNFHSILTPFDMLMLRTLYSPELSSGMSRAEVAARLPAILDRLNPAGRGVPTLPRAPSSPAWKQAIETAMTRSNSADKRIDGANRAVRIASAMRPTDHRLGVALLTRGRLMLRSSPERAAADFARSWRIFRDAQGPQDIRTAQAALHLAVASLREDRFETSLRLANDALGPALRGENAVLASGLYAIRAESLIGLGRATEAKDARLESLKWARYAFGDIDGAIASAQAQLEALAPRPNATSRQAF